MSEQDIRQNAGRCDWCGSPVDMESGDVLTIASEEDFGNEEHDVSPQEAVDAIADAMKAIGCPKDEMLADTLREEIGYRLHERCFQESALEELHSADY